MKKFLCMTLLLTAMFLTFSACSSDDDEKNSLSGTEWVTKYADDYLIIKFTSDSKVEGYFADSNFVMDGRLSSGTYTIDGSLILHLYPFIFCRFCHNGSVIFVFFQNKIRLCT